MSLFLSLTIILYFNSIKVQLEQEVEDKDERDKLFQFHKGTIRTFLHSHYKPQRQTFQFHKGTIRTQVLRLRLLMHLNFNSIKVQLEQATLENTQSIKNNFNSIKVQLEPAKPLQGETASGFQFHKGTIRTFFEIVGDRY